VFSEIKLKGNGNNMLELKDFPLVLALETRNISLIKGDGQLGLRYDDKKHMDFISVLYKKRIIKKESFAFFFNKTDNSSKISSYLLLGEENKEENMRFLSFNPLNFSLSIKGIQITDEKLLIFDDQKVFIDIDDYFLRFPVSFLKKFLEVLLKKTKGICDEIGSLIFCSFDEKMMSSFKIGFVFNEKMNFAIAIEKLFDCKPLIEYKIPNYCLLRIKKSKNFVLSMPFFENFYSYFDISSKKIGILNMNFQQKNVVFEENYEEIDWESFFYLACVIILVLLIILAVLLKRKVFNYSKIKPKENSLNITENNDGISLNNESFIGGDSFHLEYELTDLRKKEENNEENSESITPIFRKLRIDEQQKKIEEIEEKEEEKEGKIQEKIQEKIKEKIDTSPEKKFGNKAEFKSLNEENDGNFNEEKLEEKSQEINEIEIKIEENKESEENYEEKKEEKGDFTNLNEEIDSNIEIEQEKKIEKREIKEEKNDEIEEQRANGVEKN